MEVRVAGRGRGWRRDKIVGCRRALECRRGRGTFPGPVSCPDSGLRTGSQNLGLLTTEDVLSVETSSVLSLQSRVSHGSRGLCERFSLFESSTSPSPATRPQGTESWNRRVILECQCSLSPIKFRGIHQGRTSAPTLGDEISYPTFPQGCPES